MQVNLPVLVCAVVVMVSSCANDGGPIEIGNDDHVVRFGGGLSDTKELTRQVSRRLKSNGQTINAGIKVSSPTEDTVKLSGSVNDDGIRQTAERMAYQVEGVRFVINDLNIR